MCVRIAPALVVGFFGCGNTATNPTIDAAVLFDSAHGGAGGSMTGSSGSAGGMTNTGGGMPGTGGATTIGSGGSSGGTGSGGSKSDGGLSSTGGTTSNDAGPTKDGEAVTVRIGVSLIGLDQARRNLDQDMPEADFERVVAHAKSAWESQLAKIDVEGGTAAERRQGAC